GVTAEHLAYVIYTSGSTGTPKGVMNRHRGVVNLLAWSQRVWALTADDALLHKMSFSFDVSVRELFAPLLSGARLVIARPGGHLDPDYLVATVRRESITTLVLSRSMLQLFVEHPELERCASLRRVVSGGEALTPGLVGELHARLPNARLHHEYGPTEATVASTVWSSDADAGEPGASIGQPINNTRVYLLDRAGEPVPVGVAGELHIGGAGVARGYLGRPELTAERFVADPYTAEPGARMYRTGDLARWLADGTLEFLGRNDAQVKVRGFRIELGEIEARLAEHADVRDAVVVARGDTPGDQRLAAYYVGAAGLDAQALRLHLSERLPDYMVPAAYVALDALPLTPNGKVDARALPAPEGDAFARRSYEAPAGEAEQALAELWQELLKVDRVSRWDNFFELGGHSLLVVTLIERMRRRGLHADVGALFTTPTLAELAAAVGSESGEVEVPANLIPAGTTTITPAMLPLVELDAAEIERIVAGVAGGAANVRDIYPLAPLQEGILFHHLLAADGDPYVLRRLTSFDSRGRLDGYLGALQAVIDRHDILRTAIVWEGLREAVQVVWRDVRLPVDEVELDGAGDAAEQLYARFDPRHVRLDVRRAPWLRVSVSHDAARDRWLLLMRLHHLAGDHTTLDVLQTEIEAHLAGRASELPAPLPFRNFVAQTRLGVSQREHEAFFSEMLGDVDEPTAPFGLVDAQGNGSGTAQARLILDRHLAARIRAEARRLGVSAASVCHVAWAQVLARVSGRDDVVFGTLLFGRMQGGEGADRVMGLFINTLPVRIRVAGEGAEAGVLRAHRMLADLLRHEHASLALAQRSSGVRAPTPLFTSLLNYRHGGSAGRARPAEGGESKSGTRRISSEERTNYPLTMSIDDAGEGLRLTAQVEAAVDPARVCALMRAALASLVHALEAAPRTPLGSLDVLPDEERRQVVSEWNATDLPFPRDLCVHERFEARAASTPHAVAVVYEDESLTYAELNARANRLAHHLRALGVGPDARVGILLPRSTELVVGLLATLKAGGAYVPLDPSLPAGRLRFMLADSAPAVVLTNETLADEMAGLHDGLVVMDAVAPAWADQPTADPHRAGLTPDHLAYVIYTSGSTGTPKGVMVGHRNLGNLISWHVAAFGLEAGQRSSSVAGLGFDATTWEIWPPLCVGASLLLPRHGADPQALLEWWAAQPLDVAFLPTPLAESAFARGLTNPHLRALLVGGDRLHAVPADAPFALINNYGPTETTVVATSGEVHAGGAPHIGRPIGNTRIYLLDGRGEPAPVGVAGEMHIGGAGVARGYLDRPELTAEHFVADPFSAEPGARMYRTGDLARWLPDGTLDFVGRSDFQVKVRGFRIELGEIDARLREHDAVREAVVLAREDASGDTRL
ncbi:MAG TPA: amino acid adenylation domain-containing protein, partial [Longimicrobium sp.]|nr:amino acid adenylation domain-containing protein [Longimicrobium sp.]